MHEHRQSLNEPKIDPTVNRSVKRPSAAALGVLIGVGSTILVATLTYKPPTPPYDAASGEPHIFAAVTAPGSGAFARSWGRTADVARVRTVDECRSRARRSHCTVDIVAPHRCEAVATPWGQGDWQCCSGTAATRADAISAALAICKRAAATWVQCRVAAQVCADDLD